MERVERTEKRQRLERAVEGDVCPMYLELAVKREQEGRRYVVLPPL